MVVFNGREISIYEMLNAIKDGNEKDEIIKMIKDLMINYDEEIQYVGQGESSVVFSIGDIVLKFGSKSEADNLQESPNVLLSEGNDIEFTATGESEYQMVFRIFEKLICKESEFTDEDVQEMYNKLRDDGLIWTDPKPDGLGYKIEENGQRKIYLVDDINLFSVEKIINEKWKNRGGVIQFAKKVSRNVLGYEMRYRIMKNPKIKFEEIIDGWDVQGEDRKYVEEAFSEEKDKYMKRNPRGKINSKDIGEAGNGLRISTCDLGGVKKLIRDLTENLKSIFKGKI